MNFEPVFPRSAFLAAAPFLFCAAAQAIGLTQVHETEPYRPRENNPETNYGILALDLLFGSNYVSWYGGMADRHGNGSYRVTNWVNNGDFYTQALGADWHFTAALIQRSTWVTARNGAIASQPGLNSIWIDTIFVHRPADSKWSGAVVLSPGASTDFDHYDERLLRLPVQASVRYEASKTLAFELGIAYTPDFTEMPVLPLLGVTWNPADDWELKARFTSVTLTHRLASRTSLGAFVSYDEASWMIGERNDFGQLRYATGTAGLELSQGFDITEKTPATIRFAAGGTFGDSLRLYDPDGDVLRASSNMDGGVFLRAGLQIKF